MNEYKYYERNYSMEKSDDIKSFRLIGQEENELKGRVFRYCRISEYSIDALVNHRFYASQPDEFNDLFEFHFNSIDFSKVDLEYIKVMPIDSDKKSLYIKAFNEERDNFFKAIYSQTIAKIGIICVTINDLSDPMWGYYGNNEGFQMELDYTKLTDRFSSPIPINYVEKIQPIDFAKVGGKFSVLIQITAKKNSWKHENEYRLLVKPSKGSDFKVNGNYGNSHLDLPYINRLVDYPKESILSITLGFNFFNFCSIKTIKPNEYLVKMDGSNCELKIKLIEACLKEQLPVKLINQDTDTFKLVKSSLIIKQVFNDTFHIKEIKNEK